MRYDLSSIPSTATVASAKLSMFAFALQAAGGLQVRIGKITSAWDTASVTWAQMTGASYTYGNATVGAGIEMWKEFDVTTVIRDLVSSPSTNFGFVLGQSGLDAESFYTSDFPDVSYRPRLVVTYDDGVERVATPVYSSVNPAFVGSMQQTISCATAGAVVRYTVDGTEPTISSQVWTDPLTLTATTDLRTKAYADGRQPSVTAVTLCQKVGGLNYQYFDGPGTGVPNLDGLTPDSVGVITWFLERQWSEARCRFRFEGFINMPAAGTYRFHLHFEFGQGRLILNGQEVCQATTFASAYGNAVMTKGWQRICIDGQKANYNYGFDLSYLPGTTGNILTPVAPSMLSVGGATPVPASLRNPAKTGTTTRNDASYAIDGRRVVSVRTAVVGVYVAPGSGGRGIVGCTVAPGSSMAR